MNVLYVLARYGCTDERTNGRPGGGGKGGKAERLSVYYYSNNSFFFSLPFSPNTLEVTGDHSMDIATLLKKEVPPPSDRGGGVLRRVILRDCNSCRKILSRDITRANSRGKKVRGCYEFFFFFPSYHIHVCRYADTWAALLTHPPLSSERPSLEYSKYHAHPDSQAPNKSTAGNDPQVSVYMCVSILYIHSYTVHITPIVSYRTISYHEISYNPTPNHSNIIARTNPQTLHPHEQNKRHKKHKKVPKPSSQTPSLHPTSPPLHTSTPSHADPATQQQLQQIHSTHIRPHLSTCNASKPRSHNRINRQRQPVFITREKKVWIIPGHLATIRCHRRLRRRRVILIQ